jgi:hypothetical protein
MLPPLASPWAIVSLLPTMAVRNPNIRQLGAVGSFLLWALEPSPEC